MGKNNKSVRRRTGIKNVGSLYKKKFRWVSNCIYCGMVATSKDHVLPISVAMSLDWNEPRLRRNLHQGLNVVPCCTQCNSIAGGKAFFTIREKRKYIQKRLRVRLKKWLRHIIWDEDEMEDLGRAMRDQIEQAMHNRLVAEQRVSWPYHRKIYKIEKRI